MRGANIRCRYITFSMKIDLKETDSWLWGDKIQVAQSIDQRRASENMVMKMEVASFSETLFLIHLRFNWEGGSHNF